MNPRYLEKPRLIELATYLPMNQYVEIIHKKWQEIVQVEPTWSKYENSSPFLVSVRQQQEENCTTQVMLIEAVIQNIDK